MWDRTRDEDGGQTSDDFREQTEVEEQTRDEVGDKTRDEAEDEPTNKVRIDTIDGDENEDPRREYIYTVHDMGRYGG
jgi:hypothetical protein